jgi:PAS domain S-box-containing protein
VSENETIESTDAQRGAMLSWVQAIAPYGIFTTDAELNIRTWNQWLVTHSGLAATDVIGRPLTELFPDVRARRLDENFRRALEGEISVLSTALHRYLLPLRSTVRTGGGIQMLQTARIAPLVFADQIVGTIATIEDVTQRESQALILRRQQEYDRLLSSALALLLASENPLQAATELFPRIAAPLKLEVYFHYLLASDGSELRLHAAGGVTPELRNTMSTLKIGDSASGHAASIRRPVVVSYVQQSDAKHAQYIRRIGLRAYASFPLLIGDRLLGTLSFGSYVRDVITTDEIEFLVTVSQYLAIAIDRALRENALREAQSSLSEHAENLETKIAERTAKLHETIAQLESFSYTVAHDLRAPIRSLKGFSEILLADYADGMPDTGQSLLRRILRASHRLDVLTRDLLQFSRVVRQDVQLGPVDVSELVHEIVAVTPQLQDGVLTMPASLGVVWAQRTLLQQCLSNLLDNALKFIGPGVMPRITLRAELRPVVSTFDAPTVSAAFNPSVVQRDIDPSTDDPAATGGLSPIGSRPPLSNTSARIRIWVEDNGIGIAPQLHEKIFGIFERVSGLDHVEGTGIGLAIVARAMQQMGGDCGVDSELGQGSRFWLELSAAPLPPGVAPGN